MKIRKLVIRFVTTPSILLPIAAFVLIMLVMVFLSGCNLAGDIGNSIKSVEARNNGSVWTPDKHADKLRDGIQDSQGTYWRMQSDVYVYECTVAMARVTPYGIDLRAAWLDRDYLIKDVCAENEP